MMTPTLHTARLILSRFASTDAPDVFAYASDPNASRHMSWRTHETLTDAEAFVALVLARPPTEPTWAIRLREAARGPAGSSVVGAIELGPTDAEVAEVHYILSEPFWNRGLMTEAVRAVLAWGWATFPEAMRVETRATLDNVGSRRVMAKAGMTFVGTTMHRWSHRAEPVEQANYAIDRPSA